MVYRLPVGSETYPETADDNSSLCPCKSVYGLRARFPFAGEGYYFILFFFLCLGSGTSVVDRHRNGPSETIVVASECNGHRWHAR